MILNIGPLDTGFRTNERARFEMIGRTQTCFSEEPPRTNQKLVPETEFSVECNRLLAAELKVKLEMVLQVFTDTG